MLISCLILCLVATSAHGKGSWSAPVSACIWGHNVEVVNDVLTLEECQERCDSTTSFDCRSVEFAGSGVGSTGFFAQQCWMSNVTSGDTSDFQKPCEGIYSNVLFSEKGAGLTLDLIEDSTYNSGTGETDWTCEFCTKASSALISHSTSTSSLEEDLALILAHLCPVWSDPDSCRTFLPTFWPSYGKLIWSGFWPLVCGVQNCPFELPEFWTRDQRTRSSAPSCQSCQARINHHLDHLDDGIAINKYREGLLKFCDTREDTEECNSIGKFLTPGALTLLKLQPRDWIIEICEQELDCKKDD